MLNYSIQIYTKLSKIIGLTYVSSDRGRQPALKRVITIISSYFCILFEAVLPVFIRVSPWSEWESSLELFQGISVAFFGCVAVHSFSIRGKCIFIVQFAEQKALNVLSDTSMHTYMRIYKTLFQQFFFTN